VDNPLPRLGGHSPREFTDDAWPPPPAQHPVFDPAVVARIVFYFIFNIAYIFYFLLNPNYFFN
jgi:hypothetical protein